MEKGHVQLYQLGKQLVKRNEFWKRNIFFLDSGGNILHQAETTKTFVDRKKYFGE